MFCDVGLTTWFCTSINPLHIPIASRRERSWGLALSSIRNSPSLPLSLSNSLATLCFRTLSLLSLSPSFPDLRVGRASTHPQNGTSLGNQSLFTKPRPDTKSTSICSAKQILPPHEVRYYEGSESQLVASAPITSIHATTMMNNVTVPIMDPKWNSKPAWKLPAWAEPIVRFLTRRYKSKR
jgi:hypothetical protein